jgi:hypothetical protein
MTPKIKQDIENSIDKYFYRCSCDAANNTVMCFMCDSKRSPKTVDAHSDLFIDAFNSALEAAIRYNANCKEDLESLKIIKQNT